MKKQITLISLGFFLSTIQAMEIDEDSSVLFAAIDTITPSHVEESLKRVKSPDITNAHGETPYQVAFKLLNSLYNEYKPLNDNFQQGLIDNDLINDLLKSVNKMYACAQIMQMVKTK